RRGGADPTAVASLLLRLQLALDLRQFALQRRALDEQGAPLRFCCGVEGFDGLRNRFRGQQVRGPSPVWGADPVYSAGAVWSFYLHSFCTMFPLKLDLSAIAA
ncbi:hypothetical protein, partial [Brevundimonas sp. UBA4553]